MREFCCASPMGFACSAWALAVARADLVANLYAPAPQVLAEGLLCSRLMPAHRRTWEKKQGRKWLVASAGNCATSERYVPSRRQCLRSGAEARGANRRWFMAEVAQSFPSPPCTLQDVRLPPPPSALVYLARRAARKYHAGRTPRSKAVSNETVFIYSHGKVWFCCGKMPPYSVWCKRAVPQSMNTNPGGRSSRCKQCHCKKIQHYSYSYYASTNADVFRCQKPVSATCQAGDWQIR